MRADSAEQRKLLDLANIDAEIARVDHRRRTLPELTEVEQAEQTVQGKRDSLVSVQTSASDLDREVEKQEREVDSVRARERKDRGVLDSGSVSSKQLADLEHEVETLQRRQSALEDDLLELMERRDALETDIQRTGAEVDKAEHDLADARTRRDENLADLDTTAERRQADRAELIPALGEDLLSLYERVRAHKGVGAALLRYRRCGACQLELDRSALAEIKNAADDAVLQCENCDAILVRTAESGL